LLAIVRVEMALDKGRETSPGVIWRLISAAPGEENLCGNDPGRKLMRTIMGAIAEYDKQMIVLKLRAGRQRKKVKQGWCEGRKRKIKLHGEESAVLPRIRKLRA
jgi:DNA invertase Pin-like site-specific DNA recombinase